jgi:hypothetical protein
MRVRTLVLAEAAYACIENGYVYLDVKLPAGCSAAQGLRQRAAELREEVQIKVRRADLIELAADQLEADKAAGRQFSNTPREAP